MSILITGANGFVGTYLTDYLQQHTHHKVYGTDARADDKATFQRDIRDEAAVKSLLAELQPDFVVHLAAQTHVPTAFQSPWDTLETNIRGTLNILEAVRHIGHGRVLIVSSSEVYGPVQAEDLPLREDQPFNPGNPYSVSKVAKEMLACQYHLAHGIEVVIVRPFNHVGPGQSTRFALADFAQQVALMERGQQAPVLKVGNLDAERDFTDVRDVVRAYHSLLEHGATGQVYNVCQGEAFKLRDLVEKLASYATIDVQIEIEQSRLRPLDVPRVVGDASRLRDATGWQPAIPMDTTLHDMLKHCRRD